MEILDRTTDNLCKLVEQLAPEKFKAMTDKMKKTNSLVESIFNFSYEDFLFATETAKTTFDEFRNSVAAKKFEYDDVPSAMNEVFLKVFDDIFEHGNNKVIFTKELGSLRGYYLRRGAIIGREETNVTKTSYERLMPNRDFMKSPNRYSPRGIEWLYLSIGETSDIVDDCCKKECRYDKGQFAICTFAIKSFAEYRKVVDLTIGAEKNQLDAAKEFISKLNNFKIELVKKDSPTSFVEHLRMMDGFVKEEINRWALQSYMNIMSEHLFERIDADKDYMYAPFHCLAIYFISKGYDGIIYKSSVSSGRNIVLFNNTFAVPAGYIDFVVAKRFYKKIKFNK